MKTKYLLIFSIVLISIFTNGFAWWNSEFVYRTEIRNSTLIGDVFWLGNSTTIYGTALGDLQEITYLYNKTTALAVANNTNQYCFFDSSDQTINCPNPPTNLIGYWTMDNAGATLYDLIGGHNGTRTGTPSQTTGIVNGAINFTGSPNDYLVSNDTELNICDSNHTFSQWVSTEYSGTGWASFFQKYGSALEFQVFVDLDPETLTYQNNLGAQAYAWDYPNDGTWFHVAVVHNSTHVTFYVNGEFKQSNLLGVCTTGIGGITIGSASQQGAYYATGASDEIRLYNTALNSTQIMQLYQSTSKVFLGETSINSNLSITINNPTQTTEYTELINATATVSWSEPAFGYGTNVTLFAYLNGTEISNTTTFINSGSTYDWNIGYLDVYEDSFELIVNGTELNQSSSASDTKNFNVVLYFLNITSPTQNGDYEKQISFQYNATCYRTTGNVSIYYWENETNYYSLNKTCPFSTSISASRESSYEGNKTITINLKPYDSRELAHNDSFWYFSDLNAPSVFYFKPFIQGFRNNVTENYTFQVNDSMSANITCEIYFPSLYVNENLTNATINYYNFTYQDGTNVFNFTCTDLAGNIVTNSSLSFTAYTKYYILIDEQTGNNFTLSNANVTAYAIDLGTTFDFNAENQIWFYWISNDTDSIRIEESYEGYDDLIIRNFEVELSYPITPICANELGSFYEQIFYSYENTPVYLISQYTGCYLVSDYTHYAYETSLMTFAHTLDKVYYLYIIDDDGNTIYLASLDGSTASQVNLDVLEYNAEGFTLSTTSEILQTSKLANETIYIYYYNDAQDNTELSFAIVDGTTNIFNLTTTTSPNELSIYFDYSTLTLTNEVLDIYLTKTKSDDSTETSHYFLSLTGKTGSLPKGFTIALSLVFIAFGITMVSMNLVSGWLGVLIGLISMAITSLSPSSWEVVFIQAIGGIVTFTFAIMAMSGQNQVST